MKKYRELDVDLVDLETFELYPGAQQFTEEFADFAVSRLRFRFEDFNKLKGAKDKLSENTIKFKEFYGVSLENDSELKAYPLVLLSFNTQYKILEQHEQNTFVNEKLANSSFNKDLGTGKLIVSEKAKVFLEKELPDLKFEHLMSKSKKNFFELLDIKTMLYPEIVNKHQEIQEIAIDEQIYYQKVISDGSMTFMKESLDEIKQNRFMTMKSFSLLGKIYETAKLVFVASGEFALKLKNEFNFEKENISLVVSELNILN